MATPTAVDQPVGSRRASAARVFLLVALFATIVLTRLPFLNAGYGANHDAWRVARAARQIAETGHYEASRLPGNPMHEIVCAIFYRGGPAALNGLSAAFSVAAAVALWLIARRMGCHDSALVTVAFALTPAVFINSVSSKDYMWAVAFLLWAVYAALRRAPIACGCLLGFAIGCRLTSGAMLLPLAVLVYAPERRWQPVVRLCAASALVGGIAFSPVWARYGFDFFTFYHSHARPAADTILARGTVEVWGALGMIGIVAALVSAIPAVVRDWPRAIASPPRPLITPALTLWLVLYVVAFIALPDQAGYLIPLVPAALLLLARFTARPAFQFACICLIVSPWIGISGAKVAKGRVLADHASRVATLRDVQQFVALCEDRLPPGTAIVVGAWEPIISELRHGTELRNQYAYLLTQSELAAAAERGTPLAYATETIRGFNYRVHGADLAAFGARNVQQLIAAPR